MDHLNEHALAQAAGWKALKHGRALLASGALLSVTASSNKLVGIVVEGGKKRRISLTINSPTDIDTRCGCPANAATGELCGHAAAVLLGCLNQPIESTAPAAAGVVEEEGFEEVAVEVRLPREVAGHLGKDGVNVGLRVVGSGEVVGTDVGLGEWLRERGVKGVPGAVRVAAGELAGFFAVLAGHPRVLAGDAPLVVAEDPGVLAVECLEEPGRLGFRRDPDESAAMVVGPGGVWLWDAERRRLATVAGGAALPGGFWRALAAGEVGWLDRAVALRHHGWLQDTFRAGDGSWLERLRFRPADLQVSLRLDGGLSGLSAGLGLVYSEGGKIITNDSFPIISNFDNDLCLTRDLAGEERAVRRLGLLGFTAAGDGGWRLAGEDAVLDFLAGALPGLRRDWQVSEGERLAGVLRQTEMVRPRLRIEATGDDWLAMDFEFLSEGGSPIPKDQIRRMLRTGQRRLRLPSGRQAVVAAGDAELLEAVMFEVNPRQEGGKFIIPASQEGYLRELERSLGDAPAPPAPGLTAADGEHLAELNEVLRPYQRAGVAWLRARVGQNRCALLADDMGLGKTLQTLAWLRLHRADHPGPALVVCPTSLLGNWEAEAAKFTPEARVLVMHGQGRQRHELNDYDLILTTYGSLVRDHALYAGHELAAVVLDEASVIRNPDAEISKAVTRVAAAARVALTGTPIENGVRDLWAVFRFLSPGYLGSRSDFRDRYEAPLGKGDPAVMRRLRMRTAPMLLRRTKGEVAKDLPSKVECIEWCALTSSQRSVYGTLLKEGQEVVAAARKSGGAAAARMKTLTTLLRLRQTCCDLALIDPKLARETPEARSGKLERLMEIVAEGIAGGKRMLIFSQFATMLGHIRGQLEGAELGCCYLDGATRDRAGEVARFQAADGPPVFLISLKAGGYGLNLTAADVVIHFDPWWNPAVEAQATDRAHRIGQTKPITVYKFISRGTVEEKVLLLQNRKRQLIDAALDESGASNPTNLDDSELIELLG